MFEEELDDEIIIGQEDEPPIEEGEKEPEPPPKPEEDEKEAYSRRVQKRIDKLTYERNLEKEERARERAERLRETQELRNEIEELKRSRQKELEDKDNQTLEQKRQELIQLKKDALEIDDHEEIIRIDDELMELKIKARNQAAQEAKPEPKPEPIREPVVEQPVTPEPLKIPEAQQVWESNNPWLFDETQKPRLEKANKLFQSLLKDGWESDDPDTFVQLDKLLKRESPPPTTAPDRGSLVGQERSKAFTQADKRKMVDWGLDPNNPTHRAKWIENRTQSNG